MKSKGTVGLVSAHYLPHLGGVERYVDNLALQLKKRGYSVVIITSKLSGMADYEEREDIRIYRFPCYELMNGRMPVIKINNDFRKGEKVLEQINFSMLIINTRLYTLSVWGSHYASSRKLPCILIEHGTAHMHFENKLTKVLGEIYEHMLTRTIKKNCHTYYGVSKACNSWIRHFNIEAKGTLYNGINPEDFRIEDRKYRKELGISENAVVISFVGRLIREKGIMKLIDAFDKLAKEKNDVYLLIAGGGELTKLIEEQKIENVFFLGSLEHTEVITLLKETDVYCLPTDYPEGFPTSVLEAAMCRCSIVATDAGGTKELVADDSYGRLLNENSVEEIKNTLVELIENRTYMQETADNAYNRVQELFTWDKTAETLEKILEEWYE